MCRACDDAPLRARDEVLGGGGEGDGERRSRRSPRDRKILTTFYHDDFEILNSYARPFFFFFCSSASSRGYNARHVIIVPTSVIYRRPPPPAPGRYDPFVSRPNEVCGAAGMHDAGILGYPSKTRKFLLIFCAYIVWLIATYERSFFY